AEGIAALTLSAKSVGRLESMYNNMKPVPLFNYSTELARQGKLAAGKTTVPFEFVLKPRGSIKSLLETYHGVFISVQYNIKCLIKRPLLNKDLSKEVEFLIEYKSGDKASHKPLNFTICPKNENSSFKTKLFSIFRQRTPRQLCLLHHKAIYGGIDRGTIGESDSVDRTAVDESGDCGKCGFAKEATEIQNIEIGCGDVCRGLAIPIYMVFPRMFSCPTVDTPNFKIEFEVNIVIAFEGGRTIVEQFPIKLTRF
uniref:Uncharacterized protein n=1 Tax=Ciona savignyi TaxID=51511 RepID=H2YPB8_CIOSA